MIQAKRVRFIHIVYVVPTTEAAPVNSDGMLEVTIEQPLSCIIC